MTARGAAALAAAALICATGCGIKGPPRPPGAPESAPPPSPAQPSPPAPGSATPPTATATEPTP